VQTKGLQEKRGKLVNLTSGQIYAIGQLSGATGCREDSTGDGNETPKRNMKGQQLVRLAKGGREGQIPKKTGKRREEAREGTI